MPKSPRVDAQPSPPTRVKLPNDLTKAVGENIRKLRQAAGLTQVDLAFDAEVERSRISKLERGHVNPSLLTLAVICNCLGTTLPALFDGVTQTLAPTSRGGGARRKNQAMLSTVGRRPSR